jgi:hypothetical protein
MSKSILLSGLCAALLVLSGLYALNSRADIPAMTSSESRSVLYLTYPANDERRCAGKERVGYRANPECCPDGFSLAGVRVNGDLADAVCVQN